MQTAPKISDTSLDYGRIPPQAVELEEAVPGAIMLERDAVLSVLDILKKESFYKESHQKIYQAVYQSLFNDLKDRGGKG